MKRRVLGKTTPFHAVFKKKEKERRNGVVLRRHCFFLFFPRTCSRGRDTFLFSSLCLFLSFPCALPPTSWWYSWAAVLRKQRLHWPPWSASWQRWQRAPYACGDGTGQGRPQSPCPYKYCLERWREGKREKKRDRGGTEEEKKQKERQRESGEKDRDWERERDNSFFLNRKGRTKGKKPQVIFERKEEWREKESKAAETKKKQGRIEEEKGRKKKGESGPEQQRRRNRNENRKKRDHRHLQT